VNQNPKPTDKVFVCQVPFAADADEWLCGESRSVRSLRMYLLREILTLSEAFRVIQTRLIALCGSTARAETMPELRNVIAKLQELLDF